MAHGFTVKEGQTDLKQYVYDAAYALLGAKPAPLGDDVVRDAARYRWLRDECDDVDVKDGLMWIAQSHETLDAAIDAATASRPQ